MVYPFISIVVILFFTPFTVRTKLLAIGFTVLPILTFIGRTQLEYHRKTGTVQFSAFGGWQMAANALYGYAYAIPDDPSTIPGRFQELHNLVNRHMDSLRHLSLRPDREVGIYYLWDWKSPLVRFVAEQKMKDSSKEYFVKWAKLAPLYNDYGYYLILKHPLSFIRHYILPNLIKYYAPPTKFMGLYNLGEDTVDEKIASWFGWKNNKIYAYNKDRRIKITEPFAIILAIVNLIFMLSFVALRWGLEQEMKESFGSRILTCVIMVWLFNMLFSIFSAPIELRYQLFPFILTFCFMWLFISCLIHLGSSKPEKGVNTGSFSPRLS